MMPWPKRKDYERALHSWQTTLLDPELRAGQLLMDGAGNPIPRDGAGLYVCVYQIGDWIVRCFHTNPEANTRPPDDITPRYQAISDFCAAHEAQVRALVPTIYLREGIQIGQNVVPLVKMRLLRGYSTLGEFVMRHHTNSAVMTMLADAWLALVTNLENAGMAHGDLDLTNVLVQDGSNPLQLRLVDYDNMFVPALAGHPQNEGGHPPFQNPFIATRPFDVTMDRFSALVIFICLRALAFDPTLYGEYQADEGSRLLLDVPDYEDYGLASGNILRLRKRLTPAQIDPYFVALITSLKDKTLPPRLDTIVPAATHPTTGPAAPAPPLLRRTTNPGNMQSAPVNPRSPVPVTAEPVRQAQPAQQAPAWRGGAAQVPAANQAQRAPQGWQGQPLPQRQLGTQGQYGKPQPQPAPKPSIIQEMFANTGNVLLFIAILVVVIIILWVAFHLNTSGSIFLNAAGWLEHGLLTRGG